MEINIKNKKIKFSKELNQLDKFVIDFTSYLNKLKIKYVLISGYVSILFGRSRSSEDIDIFIEKLSYKKFKRLWEDLYKKFECITTEDPKSAYDDYLNDKHAIRFSYKGQYLPNMEAKFCKLDIDEWTLNNRKEVSVNNHKLFISPIEIQIPFKFRLGSDKDIEDAIHLYDLFKNHLDKKKLYEFNQKLNIQGLFDEYIE